MTIIYRIVSAVAIMVLLSACDASISTEEYIARANQFMADNKYESAIIELKNALQNDSDSAEARWLLGKFYLDSGDMQSAEKELERAGKLGWPTSDVIPALAESLLAQGKYSDVEQLSRTQLEPAADARLLTSKAVGHMAQGDMNAARSLVTRALQKAPGLPYARLVQSRLNLAEGDLIAASAEMEDTLALEPEYAPGWSLMGDIRVRQAREDEALSAYDKAIAGQHNNFSDRFKRALLFLQRGNIDEARSDTAALLRQAPHHPAANYLQGLIHFYDKKFAEAVTSLSVAETVADQFPMVLYFLGSAQLMEGKLDRAAVFAAQFYRSAPQSISGRKLLATVRLQQEKYVQVQKLLAPVLDANPDDVGALNLMSNALMRDGKTEEGIALLARVAALQPGSPVAQVRLGAGLLMSGKGDDAEQHMETALELDPRFQQADILLVLNQLNKQDYPAAISAAQAYRRRNLASATPLNLLGKVYLAAGQLTKARESFEKALTLDAGDEAANLNLGQMAMADGELASARKSYTAILDSHPDSLPALLALAVLEARANNAQALVARLEEAIGAHPAALEPKLLLGRYYLGQGKPGLVAPLFVSLEGAQKRSPQVLQLVARAQLSDSDPAAATATLEQLLKSTPPNAAVHHLMAMSATSSGDTVRGKKELQRALKLDEDFLPSRIVLAQIALSNRSMDEFNQHMVKLQSLAPENADVLVLRAAAANLRGETAEAVKLAEQAFTLAPKTSTLLALGAQLQAAGQQQQLVRAYRDWLAVHPDDLAVRVALANRLQIVQDIDAAKLEYQKILELEPNNLMALNNLAWSLREERPEQALELARRATEVAPDSAEAQDTLAVVQYINKDYKQAERSIGRALRTSPNNPSLIYHSAMIAAASGREDAAIAQLQELEASTESFPERSQALQLLTKLRE